MKRPHPSWLVLSTVSLVCLAWLAVGPSAVKAAGPPEPRGKSAAKIEVQKAQLHYKLGRFEDALAAYSHAYELFPAPALLFNLGQCHKNLKNYERAIFFFEGYLREETSPNPRTRTLARELVVESRIELERQRAAEAEQRKVAPPRVGTAPSSSVAEMFGAPPPANPAPVLVDSKTDNRIPAARPPLLRRWWFWTAIGVATVAGLTGALVYSASGHTTFSPPEGTLGTLDRRAAP